MTKSLPKHQQVTAARVAALGPVPQDGCLSAARKGALDRVLSMGLPQRRDEYWKFTPAQSLVDAVTPAAFTPAFVPLTDAPDDTTVHFVGARMTKSATIPGIDITPLSEVATRDQHWSQDTYGSLEARGHNRVDRALAAMNTAYADNGALIDVTQAVDQALSITYHPDAAQAEPLLHHVIRIGEGASLTLIEEGLSGQRTNIVIEVVLARGAEFRHVRLQGDAPERQVITHIFAELHEASKFKSFTACKNGVLTRNEAVVTILGDDCEAHIGGTHIGDGPSTHQDDTVFVTHNALKGQSRQVYKKVLRNGATGVFQGKILVEPGAQKTDGYQISQSLLLDDDAQFFAKPELEIYADDVACSHGSTTGAIDEDALFYLRSRGMEKKRAENLLTLSFLSDAVAEIDDEALESAMLARLATWLDE